MENERENTCSHPLISRLSSARKFWYFCHWPYKNYIEKVVQERRRIRSPSFWLITTITHFWQIVYFILCMKLKNCNIWVKVKTSETHLSVPNVKEKFECFLKVNQQIKCTLKSIWKRRKTLESLSPALCFLHFPILTRWSLRKNSNHVRDPIDCLSIFESDQWTFLPNWVFSVVEREVRDTGLIESNESPYK